MAFSLDDIKKYSQNPTTIPSPGSYGEGLLYNIGDMANTLKSAVQAGKLSVVDYQAMLDPLMKTAVGYRMSQNVSGARGDAIAGAFNPLFQNGFLEQKVPGTFTTGLGFSQSDYAKLPVNVLPTQGDVSKGIFNPNLAPTQRYQDASGNESTTPVTNPTSQPATGPGGSQLPQISPSLPPGIDTTTDQGRAALQGANNAAQLQDALNKQYQVNKQAVDQFGQSISGIPDIYKNEGVYDQQQLDALAETQKSQRAQALTDLGGILATNQLNLFNKAVPDLAEQANTSGIYRSTGFGNILAQKYANLTQDTQQQLALQGITDRNDYLSDIKGSLAGKLSLYDQAAQAQATGLQTTGAAGAGALQAYGSGLGDVANAQIGMQNAGLQRSFSLADYATQYQNALQFANQTRASGPSGKAQSAQTAQNVMGYANAAKSVLSIPASVAGKGVSGGSTTGSYNPNAPMYEGMLP